MRVQRRLFAKIKYLCTFRNSSQNHVSANRSTVRPTYIVSSALAVLAANHVNVISLCKYNHVDATNRLYTQTVVWQYENYI